MAQKQMPGDFAIQKNQKQFNTSFASHQEKLVRGGKEYFAFLSRKFINSMQQAGIGSLSTIYFLFQTAALDHRLRRFSS